MSRVTSARKNGRVLPLALSSLFALAMAALPALGQYTQGPSRLSAARLEKIKQSQVRPMRSTSAVKRPAKPTQTTSAKRPFKPKRTLRITQAALRRSVQIQPELRPMTANSRTPSFYRAGSRTLYSTIMEYVGITDWDVLWKYPTVGPDGTTEGKRLNIPQSFEVSPPEGFNIVDVAYGNMGQPAEINFLTIAGNVRTINPTTGALTNANGPFIVLVFDGVDADNPPDTGELFTSETPTNFGNIALRSTSTPTNVQLVFYNAQFGPAQVPGVYSFNLTPATPQSADLRFKINDPQGRFGIMVAKVEGSAFTPARADDGPFAQWIWWANSAVGPNLVWTLDGLAAPIGLFGLASDDTFNQSARGNSVDNIYGDDGGGPDPETPTFGTINYFFQVRGNTLDRVLLPTGILAGNMRQRGVDIPAPATPESKPRTFDVFTFDTGTDNLRRIDTLWTQPSYDAIGTLTEINYIIEGLPVGNFDFVFVNRPIFSETDVDATHQIDLWPFSDFNIFGYVNVPIADAIDPIDPNQLNATFINDRFDIWADMDNGTQTGVLDNIVDVNDLSALILSFDKSDGDPGFIPSTDVAGDPFVNAGAPNGITDISDLSALIEMFDRGGHENP